MLSSALITPTLPAVDLERAKEFYKNTLGLSLVESPDGGGIMFQAGNGTRIFLYKRGASKADHTAASFSVSDIAAEMENLRGKGVVFEEYDFPGLKTENGIAIHGDMKAAWFKDTEGNILGLTQVG